MEELGGGEPILGLTTERYRVRQRFAIDYGAYVQRVESTSEVWVSAELANVDEGRALRLRST